MHAMALQVVAVHIGAARALPVSACKADSGERTQRMAGRLNGASLGMSTPNPGKIEAIKIPNGFTLGLGIDPAEAAVYAADPGAPACSPEMVKISLRVMPRP